MSTGPQSSRLEVLPLDDKDDASCATFVLHGEDHTLGNALRWMLMKNPVVTFCGYSVPHPSEKKINLRIQTNGEPAADVMRQGLEDLKQLSEHVLTTFKTSMDTFKINNPNNIKTQPDESES